MGYWTAKPDPLLALKRAMAKGTDVAPEMRYALFESDGIIRYHIDFATLEEAEEVARIFNKTKPRTKKDNEILKRYGIQ